MAWPVYRGILERELDGKAGKTDLEKMEQAMTTLSLSDAQVEQHLQAVRQGRELERIAAGEGVAEEALRAAVSTCTQASEEAKKLQDRAKQIVEAALDLQSTATASLTDARNAADSLKRLRAKHAELFGLPLEEAAEAPRDEATAVPSYVRQDYTAG